jgi:hypothetical protein
MRPPLSQNRTQMCFRPRNHPNGGIRSYFVALADGRACGYLQRYSYADNLGYLGELWTMLETPAEAYSIDYFIGEAAMLRRG